METSIIKKKNKREGGGGSNAWAPFCLHQPRAGVQTLVGYIGNEKESLSMGI
jgi:hypothetical protein